MERPHPTLPSVKMTEALASYICNCKFQFKVSLRIEKCKFQQKAINVFSVTHIQIYILQSFNVKFYIRLSILRWS